MERLTIATAVKLRREQRLFALWNTVY